MAWCLALKNADVKGGRYSIRLVERVEMRCGSWKIGKKVNRECPQGLVVGPQIWKSVFDEFIRKIEMEVVR